MRARPPKEAAAIPSSPPAAARPAAGVNLVGLIRAETGIGEFGRLAARALQTTGIPFGILNCPVYGDYRNEDMTWAHKEMQGPSYNVKIFHTNGNTMKHVVDHFGASLLQGRYNIGFWHWQLPELPDFYAEGFQFLQEVWAPSAYVAANIAKKLPIPVIHIPHGIEVAYDAAMAAGYPNIVIMDRTLSRHEVSALIACTDSFVSLHRAEGFGLGLAEAMYLGKPFIGTHWSGFHDPGKFVYGRVQAHTSRNRRRTLRRPSSMGRSRHQPGGRTYAQSGPVCRLAEPNRRRRTADDPQPVFALSRRPLDRASSDPSWLAVTARQFKMREVCRMDII